MELIYEGICQNRLKNEDEIIEELASFLKNGGAIDSFFLQKNSCDEEYLGTILHYSIECKKQRVVEYALSNGANIAIECTAKNEAMRYQNAVELAAKGCDCKDCDDATDDEHFCKDPIFEMVKNRSLQLYSEYGLTTFHLDCAIETQFWSYESIKQLANDVNKAVSVESPLWPRMTPLLIAAQFENNGIMKWLLDLGADPCARDSRGNTPLHLFYTDNYYYPDERLFAHDAKNTFGSIAGESHFHIACREELHDIVKRYLDQGISPDLPIKGHGLEDDTDAGKTGLHIAVEVGAPELVELLLEYGADVDKEDSKGHSPIGNFIFMTSEDDPSEEIVEYIVECIRLLIEVGAKIEKLYEKEGFQDDLSEFVSSIDNESKLSLFRSIRKLTVLNNDTYDDIPETLWGLYDKIVYEEEEDVDEWESNANSYDRDCLEELKGLVSSFPGLGLRQILDDTITVKPDFAEKCRKLESFDFESYPIYGNMLKIKSKRKLLELKKKKRKIPLAIPKVQWLFQNQGSLPHLCADIILWNLNNNAIDLFMEQ